MSRVIISIVAQSEDSFAIDATDGKSSFSVICKENYILWNLFKIKLRFILSSLQRGVN